MLALRRKTLSPSATASLTMRLVDLALVSSKETYCEIISLLATLSKESIYSENNLLNTSVRLFSAGYCSCVMTLFLSTTYRFWPLN